MRSAVAVAAVAVLAACGGAPTEPPSKPQIHAAMPATLESTAKGKPPAGEPRAAHVRVWADAETRAQPHWKEDIIDQLDYADALLIPLFGVRLQVDEIKDWDRVADPHVALAELAKLDPGAGVTWVIGYVAPLPTASKVMTDLGDAEPLGQHIVIRSWAVGPETERVTAKLASLSAAQQAEILSAHRRHKQTVIALHELAITLCAIGATDTSWIMNPFYDLKQSTFADRNRELMQLALDARLDHRPPAAIARAVIDFVDKTEWGGWIPAQREDTIARLRNLADAARAGEAAADIPAAAYAEFDRIRQLAKSGDRKQALAELDNLSTAYPANATLAQAKCELVLADAGPKSEATRAACAHVSELAPGDPSVHLALGEALAKSGDLVAAHAELELAAARIGHLAKGGDLAWKRLIGVYTSAGALTWTEDALAAAKLDGDPAAAEVAQTRARYGVPRGAKFVRPEDEAALVAAVKAVFALTNDKKFGEAAKAAAAIDKRWPNAPGAYAARCDLGVRSQAYEAARAACDKAIALDPHESWALYLSAVIALRDTSTAGGKLGIERLKKAIEVDPDLQQAWRALGRAYERAHATADRAALADAYAAKFGQRLAE